MEHVASTPQGNDQWRLTAEPGYLLKSKKSGNTYKTIDTRNLKLWEVVEDPDFVKPETKAAKPTTEVAGTETKAEGKAAIEREQSDARIDSAEREQTNQRDAGKPQTKKRANRKGK